MRYELEPKGKRTGNAILYEDLNTPGITKNKAYLVVGHDGKSDSVSIIDNNFKIFDNLGPHCGRRFIKQIDIKHAEPGDDIIFLRYMDYSESIKPFSGNPKKGQVFTITKIDGNTIFYGPYSLKLKSAKELVVQSEDVIILKTIKNDIPIQDYIVDIKDTTVSERLELRDVMIYNLQHYDSILYENRIRDMNYAGHKILKYNKNSNSWSGALTFQDKPNISCKDFIEKFKKKSDDEKQIIQDCIQPVQIKKQNKEAIMPFQDIINSIFGVSAYDQKPKFLVTIYKPDGSEYASATATSIDDIKQKAATDYRLIGHKIVVYKLHTEITTEIPVVITRLKDEKSKEPEIDKQ